MDLFALAARLFLDKSQYEKGIAEAQTETKSFAERLGAALQTAAKVAAAAVGAASGAVTAMIKQGIDKYADYEQLVGGVETLFKGSADRVQAYANNAYRTAGLSASDYMATVTGFSASLLQSLGGDTEKAADYANMAITDMSDNANKMGTDMGSIQAAYQGFAKQNYTMLDNLKLGYGGTKEEMERLVQDAEKLDSTFKATRDENGNLAMSYADIVDAIHIVQTDMGITGTTAKEASETISGSVGAMKAAWDNLVTGLGDDTADMDTLIGNFVYSAETAAFNLIPRIETILSGIGDVITRLTPYIVDKLPLLTESIIPSLLTVAGNLVSAVVGALVASFPSMINTGAEMLISLGQGMAENLPSIGQNAAEIVAQIITSIAEHLPELILVAADIIVSFADTLTDPANLTTLIESAVQLVLALAEGLIKAIPQLIAAIPTIIANLVVAIVENAPKLLDAGVQLIGALGSGIVQSVGTAVTAFGQVADTLVKGAGDLVGNAVEWGKNTVHNLAEGMQKAKEKVGTVLGTIKKGVTDWAKNLSENSPTMGGNLITNFVGGIGKNVKNLWDSLKNVGTGTRDFFKNLWESAKTWGNDLITSFTNGIREFINKPIDAVKSLADNIKSFLGFSEPELGPLSNFHTYAPDMMALFAKGITDNEGLISDAIGSAFNFGPQLAMSGAGAMGGQEIVVPRVDRGGQRDITIVLELDGLQFGRAVYKANNEETQRVGVKIETGGTM